MRRGGNFRSPRGGYGSNAYGNGGGAVAAFAPDSIASAFAWYRADLGVTTSGGAVSEWQDQIGTRHAVQATGARQPAHTASIAGLNGNAGITGDGADDKMALGGVASDWTFLHNGAGATLYLVVRTPGAASEGAIFDTQRVSNGNAGVTFYHQAAGNPIIRASNDASGSLWTHSATAVANSTTYQYLITHSTGAGYVIRRNGVELASGAYNGTPRVTDAGTVPGLWDSVTSVGVWSNWTLAELLVCNAVISAGDLADLEDYGATRYGL